VNRALLFLTVRSLANRARRKLGRLRTPRYAIAFALGAAFLWVFLIRQPAAPPAPARGVAEHRELVMAILASWAVAWSWAFGSRRVALTFTLAETDFLFTAPVSRRELIRFKLLQSQGRVLWSALIWTLVLSRSETGTVALLHALGLWILLSTLQLHRLGASLTRNAVTRHGRPGFARHWVTVVAVAATAVAAAVALAASAPALVAAAREGTNGFLTILDREAARPLAHAVLLPFRVLVGPAAADAPGWFRAAVPALLLLGAHFVWVTRADASFEESAADAARRRAARIEARGTAPASAGRPPARPVFRLAAEGRPATAIFWKNVIAAGRVDRFGRIALGFVLAAAAIALLALRHVGNLAHLIGTLAGTWAMFAVLIGPQWVRNDLRTDLQRLELLRSYPVRGASIVAAEVAASAAILTLVQFMLGVAALAAFVAEPWLADNLRVTVLAALGVGFFIPAVNYLGLLLLNGGALLFPAWVRIGPTRAAGIEGLGQNVVVMAAYGLTLVVALIPAGLAAGAAWWAMARSAATWGWVAAGIAGLAVIAAECRLLLEPLGRAFERIDLPSSGIEQR
jgi:hypothetical protein